MIEEYFFDEGTGMSDADYCKCEHSSSIASQVGEFGYWDICCDCGKLLEDGFHYYNHYDGEDHDDIDCW